MRVLIISSNTLPASPSGPAYVAGAVRQAGHDVDVYESLFASDLAGELATRLDRFQPDVVGLSIRLVHGDVLDPNAPLGTRHLDLRPRVERDRGSHPQELRRQDRAGRTGLQLLRPRLA